LPVLEYMRVDREPLRLLSPVKVGHFVPLGAEYVAVEKQEGVQGLVLRGGGDVSLSRQMRQGFPDLRFPPPRGCWVP
jgi:hypothetical protein